MTAIQSKTDFTHNPGDANPAGGFFSITPSDVSNFTQQARGIYVGVGGDIAVVSAQGTVVTFKNAVAGTILPVRCKRVNVTNTTATNLVGLF